MIGIVVATEMEAGPLVRVLGAKGSARLSQFGIYEFPAAEGRLEGRIIVTGMGPSLAAEATEQLLCSGNFERIINAGVCGSLTAHAKRGEVFRIKRVSEAYGDAGKSQSEAFQCSSSFSGLLPAADLVTVGKPVFEESRRERLALCAQLADMEGHAVVDVCRRHGMPCDLIKGVTDFADTAGKDDIQRHLDDVSCKVADAVVAALSRPVSTRLTVGKFLNFTRIEHSLFSLPMLLAGAYLGAGMAAGVTGRMPSWRVLLLIALAGTGARMLGMATNRIFDRDLDAQNPRTAKRELPSGRMNLQSAVAVAGMGLAAYLGACWLLGPLCLMLSAVPGVPLITYSLLKRFTPLCHFGIGLCLALAPLGGYVAAAGSLHFSPAILALAVFAFCWMSGFDILYALQDLESDRRTGVRSIPASLGFRGAFAVAGVTHAAALAAAGFLWVYLDGGWLSGISLAVTIGGIAYAYLPNLSLPQRFFPTSAVASAAAAMIVLAERLP